MSKKYEPKVCYANLSTNDICYGYPDVAALNDVYKDVKASVNGAVADLNESRDGDEEEIIVYKLTPIKRVRIKVKAEGIATDIAT